MKALNKTEIKELTEILEVDITEETKDKINAFMLRNGLGIIRVADEGESVYQEENKRYLIRELNNGEGGTAWCLFHGAIFPDWGDVDEDGICVYPVLYGGGKAVTIARKWALPKNIFESEEEAEQECKRRNEAK